MKSNQFNQVIIVGGGHNGLVCACYLAEAGFDVLVLERRSIVGGAVVTEEFHRGFRNSTASYTVGLLSPQVIRDLRLYQHGLEIIPRQMANFFPLSDERFLQLYSDDALTQNEIAKFSVRDANALPKFRIMIHEVGEVVKRIMYRTPPNIGGGLQAWIEAGLTLNEVRKLSGHRIKNLTELFLLPIADLLDKWFENPHVKAAFAFDALVGNFSSLHSTGTSYGLLHHALGQTAGQPGVWGHAKGGMGSITQAMLKRAQELGVRVETDAEVVQITVERGRATMVILADGREYPATLVVANVAPKHLYLDLLQEQDLSPDFLNNIQQSNTESAVLRMNVALSELPQFICKPSSKQELHHSSGIVIGPTIDYMEKAYQDAVSGTWSTNPVIEMLIPSTVDPALAQPGKHVASLFCQYFPYDRDWDINQSKAVADIYRTIDEYAPNFSRSVIADQVLTPLDLEREFRLPRGDIFHGAHSLSQIWSARPLMGYAAYQGLLKNLYHCGAGSHPGGGVTGIPGLNASREIIRHFGTINS